MVDFINTEKLTVAMTMFGVATPFVNVVRERKKIKEKKKL